MSAHPRTADLGVEKTRPRAADHIPVMQRTWGSWRFSLEREPLRADELTAQYDRAAATWKRRLRHLGVPQAYARLMRGLLTEGLLRTLPSGAWVLDAGTGTGTLSLALDAQHRAHGCGDRLMFSVVDRSPAMLRAARTAFDATPIDVALRRADIHRLPFDDGVFDFVMAGHVIEHLPAPEAAVRELVRVLRPGAPLLLLTTRQSLLGALVHLRWRVHRFGASDLSALLEASGLEDIRCAPLPGAPLSHHLSLVCTARKAKRPTRSGVPEAHAEASR